MDREQFEASFRAAVDNVILPAATQVKQLVTPTSWVCLATKSDSGLSAKVEIYQGNMKATTGERPHVKILAAAKANDVQIYIASQRSGGSKQSTVKAEDITEQMVQEYGGGRTVRWRASTRQLMWKTDLPYQFRVNRLMALAPTLTYPAHYRKARNHESSSRIVLIVFSRRWRHRLAASPAGGGQRGWQTAPAT